MNPSSYLAIPLLPLLGFFILTFFDKALPKKVAGGLASFLVFASFGLSLAAQKAVVASGAIQILAYEWIRVDKLVVPMGFLLDSLSVWMALIVTGISGLIHVYSIGYMKDDPESNKFFSWLNLFVFFMLVLVMADNYLGMFIGWEGVGVCSFLLIGFWEKVPEYNKASKKALVMNRVVDLGFIIAMICLSFYTGTLGFSATDSLHVSMIPHSGLVLITLGFFWGATGKSAQLPLYTWLPDAMAGPTPVSALIHAATMVTAGIYLVVRSMPLYLEVPGVLDLIAWVGAYTSLLAGLIALRQNDIKKVLAYSTVSQLGLMFVAVGLGAVQPAMFHLTTHAFFKALLFLAAGSVIHAMHHEQNLMAMGGLARKIPVTFAVFTLGGLALVGCPPLSGYFSKDEILLAALHASPVLFSITVMISLCTVFYTFRALFLAFGGTPRSEQAAHAHESEPIMLGPLVVLAVLATFGGKLGIVLTQRLNTPEVVHDAELAQIITAATVVVLLVLGGYCYFRFAQSLKAANAGSLWGRLLAGKFYVDEIYQAMIMRPFYRLARLLDLWIENLILSPLVDFFGRLPAQAGAGIKELQTGSLGFYLIFMALGVVATLALGLLMSF